MSMNEKNLINCELCSNYSGLFNDSQKRSILGLQISQITQIPPPTPVTPELSTVHKFVGEIIGTFLLVFIGLGISANQALLKTKSTAYGGVLANVFGWGAAIFIAVLSVNKISGAHLNPAISFGMAVAGNFQWSHVPLYIVGQCIGAFLGGFFIWLTYYPHFNKMEKVAKQVVQLLGSGEGLQEIVASNQPLLNANINNQSDIAHITANNNSIDSKLNKYPFKVTKTELQKRVLSVFSTIPEIYHILQNLFQEACGTFILQFSLLLAKKGQMDDPSGHQIFPLTLGALGALPVAFIFMGCLIALGGTTGGALNPARDLMPRIVHYVFPIKGKGSSQWFYAWIPVAGPLLGAILGGAVYRGLGDDF